MNDVLLSARGLTKTFGDFTAVDGVSTHLRAMFRQPRDPESGAGMAQASLNAGLKESLAMLLVMRKGMVLTKDVFLNHLYGGLDEPEVKIIDVFICKLRKKLAEAGAPNVIGTVWGRGYTVRDAAAPGVLESTVPFVPEPARMMRELSHAA